MHKKSHGHGKKGHGAHTNHTHHHGNSHHGVKMNNMKHTTKHSAYGSKHSGSMHHGESHNRKPSGGPAEAVPQNEHVTGNSGMAETFGGSVGKSSIPSMNVTGRKTGMQGPNVSGQ